MLKNPGLEKSGSYLAVGQKRNTFQPIQEIPLDWNLNVTPDKDGNAPAIFINDGMSIDGAYMPFRVELSQHGVSLAKGRNYLDLKLFSHVEITVGNTNINAVSWTVAFQPDGEDGATKTGDDLFISPEKGDQSFSVEMISPDTVTGTLRIVYEAAYGNTNGSMIIQGISLNAAPAYSLRSFFELPKVAKAAVMSDYEEAVVLVVEIEERLDRLKKLVSFWK